MSYYDNVKDNVQGKGDEDSSNQFESLKQAAEETSNEPDEEKGDDTPIEVLEEDGLSETAPSKKKTQASKDRESSGSKSRQESRDSVKTGQDSRTHGSSNPMTTAEATNTETNDFSGLEEKLDRIIEQNERMIEILESFGS